MAVATIHALVEFPFCASVSGRNISNLSLSSTLLFVSVRHITAVCKLYVDFDLNFGALSLVSFSGWQFEKRLIDKFFSEYDLVGLL